MRRNVVRLSGAAQSALGRAQPYQVKFGTGGRSSNSGITATVFGAYGFVGKYLCDMLGACGSRVYVPYRGCEMEVRHLKPSFDLGQIGLMPFSARDRESIFEAIQNSDVVINLIGKHYETKHAVPTRREDGSISNINFDFEEVNCKIPETLAELSKAAGVKTFIHVSALSANVNSISKWSQTKSWGEMAVRNKFPEAIIVKPATIFGPEDRFLNSIAEANVRLPFSPVIHEGTTLTQPVDVVDVARGIMTILENNDRFAGESFQFCGPAEYTMREVAEFVADVTTVRKPIADVPEEAAIDFGLIGQNLINPLLTKDQVLMMKEDNVQLDDPNLLTFKDLDIEPESMDKKAFDFLHRFRPGGHFNQVTGYH